MKLEKIRNKEFWREEILVDQLIRQIRRNLAEFILAEGQNNEFVFGMGKLAYLGIGKSFISGIVDRRKKYICRNEFWWFSKNQNWREEILAFKT